jgi:hypothetical protein
MKKFLILALIGVVVGIVFLYNNREMPEIRELHKLINNSNASGEALTLEITNFMVDTILSLDAQDAQKFIEAVANLPNTRAFNAARNALNNTITHPQMQEWRIQFDNNTNTHRLSDLMERITR